MSGNLDPQSNFQITMANARKRSAIDSLHFGCTFDVLGPGNVQRRTRLGGQSYGVQVLFGRSMTRHIHKVRYAKTS
jgi:hypothetical protein